MFAGAAFEPTAFEPTAFQVSARAYVRMLYALLPPGRLWRSVGGLLSDLFAACADELARLDARAADLLDESVPTTALELLPEYERELDLDTAGTEAERQARVLAHTIARPRCRPIDIKTSLAPLLGQAALDVVLIERTRAYAISVADDREIYRLFVYRDPTLPGEYYVASAQALLDKIGQSHVAGYVIESIDMRCDDPYSLCDRDVLGA